MKDVRFYLEYPSPTEKRKGTRANPGNHEGNVFAAFVGNGTYIGQHGKARYEGLGAVYYHANSAVAGTSVTLDYLSTYCLHISEEQAREIHPALFERLDQED